MLNDGRVHGTEKALTSTDANLIFINACVGARTGSIVQTTAANEGLALEFLRSGASSFLSTLWPVTDEAARTLGLDLMAHMFSGPIGLALASAKRSTIEKYPGDFSPNAYVLFGDPTMCCYELNLALLDAARYELSDVPIFDSDHEHEILSRFHLKAAEKYKQATDEFIVWAQAEDKI